MDNYTYGTTELVGKTQQPPSQADMASTNSVPYQNNMTKIQKPQNTSPGMESFYDMVTTENSGTDDNADYSILNCDNDSMKKLHLLSD